MLPTGSVSLSIFNLSGTYIDCDGTHTGTSWYCEQYSAAAGTVIATQDVGHDGVLLGVGDVVEAHAEGSAEGHGQAVGDVAFHGQGRADGMVDARQQLCRSADDGPALPILLLPRALADVHQRGVGVALAGHDVISALAKPAAAAVLHRIGKFRPGNAHALFLLIPE